MRRDRAAPRGSPSRRSRAWQRLTILALLVHAAACTGADIVLGDGRGDAAATVDAAAPEPIDSGGDAGAVRAPFSEPLAIDSISGPDTVDDDPSLTADRTQLCFNSEREGGLGAEDIWCARRDDPTQAWEPPVHAVELNTEQRETGIALAADGLAIWWSSDRPDGLGGLDVYAASRASRSESWSSIRRVPELSSAGDDLVSAVSDGNRAILLARRASEGDDYDLFVAGRRDPLAAWEAPEPLAAINTDDEESDAFPLEGGRTLIFTRDEDLYLAQRATTSDAFSVGPIEELNSGDDDRDAWAAEDFSYVVFSSDRTGSYLLYEASR